MINAAFATLGWEATKSLRELDIYVIDTNDLFAFIRGNALIVSRAQVESPTLAAVLSHEISHASTTDARLMLALDRLVLWVDPLAQGDDENPRREHGTRAGLIMGSLRLMLRIAGGDLTQRLLSPLWAPYLRERERAADLNAVALGQGPALAKHLKAWKQPSDHPNPRVLFNLQWQDRVAYRLDTLLSEPPLDSNPHQAI